MWREVIEITGWKVAKVLPTRIGHWLNHPVDGRDFAPEFAT